VAYILVAAVALAIVPRLLPESTPDQVRDLLAPLLIIGFPLVLIHARRSARRRSGPGGWLNSRAADYGIIAISLAILLYLAMDGFSVIPSSESLGKGPEVITGDDFAGVLFEPSLAILPGRTRAAPGDDPPLTDPHLTDPQMTGLVFEELRRRLERAEGLELAAALPESRAADGHHAASEIGVGWVLSGGDKETADGQVVAFELSRAGEPTSVWEGSVRLGVSGRDIDRIAGELLGALGVTDPGFADIEAGWSDVRAWYAAAQLADDSDSAVRRRALAQAQALTERSPGFARAWALRGNLHLQAALGGGGPDARTELEQARVAALEATGRDSREADGWLLTGRIRARVDRDWRGALTAFERALDLAPSNIHAVVGTATQHFTLGHLDRGREGFSKAIRLDRLDLSHRLRLGLLEEFAGAYKAAIEVHRQLLVHDPDYPAAHAFIGRALISDGRARSALLHMELEADDFWSAYGMALASAALSRPEAHELAAEFEDRFGAAAPVQAAEIQALAGEVDRAFDWLNRAVAANDPGVAMLLNNPLLKSLQGDSRWTACLQGAGLAGAGQGNATETE
jgi:tetratricopeptide (TPR) repeat protein